MRSYEIRYWIFQFVGWSTFFILFLAINVITGIADVNGDITPTLRGILVLTLSGLLFTHGLRTAVLQFKVFEKPQNQQMLYLLGFTIFFCGLHVAFLFFILVYLGRENPTEDLIGFSLPSIIVFFIWGLLYLVYHYLIKNRRETIDKLKLENVVKRLELRTIKANINPHFIFNSLNSIRALVDENPTRAREAITELSNILRNSLSIENKETVLLSHELSIIKDYLALEQMRFEDRLYVTYQIDGNTLGLSVPPMMVQTLVENGIKHGISTSIEGGAILIQSFISGDKHVLVVKNTGNLLQKPSTRVQRNASSGFGLASTRSRLQLLYADKASFDIIQEDARTVTATVYLPLSK